jgi:cell division protein FtsB
MEKKRLIVILIAITALLVVIFLPGFSELQKLREENDQYKKRVGFLEQRNNKLKGELSRLKRDPVYLEKKAREKLGIVKKGEIIYSPSSQE